MLIADYILYVLNSRKNTRYVTWMGLDGPCDCITTTLTKACIHLNIMYTVKDFNASGGLSFATLNPYFKYLSKYYVKI